MKKFNFKSKGAVLRVIEEPKIKKKAWTFDRIIYVALLLFLAFVIIRYSYNVLNVIKGNGQIVFQKLSINFTTDVRLHDIYIAEGEKVHKGDTLFSYVIEKAFEDDQNAIRASETKNKIARDILGIEKEILLKRTQLIHVKKEQQQWIANYDEKVNMVLLEVAHKNELNIIKQKQRALTLEAKLIAQEIYALQQLKRSFKNAGDQLLSSYGSISNTFQHYIAPVDGISGTINFEANEVCYRQQEVVTIHDSKELMIRAYFSQKYNDYIQPGTAVTIKFSDGTVTKGKISNAYIATYALPSEFQKKYEPTERNILVDIIPANKDAEVLWRKFYLMDVSLTINRWTL